MPGRMHVTLDDVVFRVLEVHSPAIAMIECPQFAYARLGAGTFVQPAQRGKILHKKRNLSDRRITAGLSAGHQQELVMLTRRHGHESDRIYVVAAVSDYKAEERGVEIRHRIDVDDVNPNVVKEKNSGVMFGGPLHCWRSTRVAFPIAW